MGYIAENFKSLKDTKFNDEEQYVLDWQIYLIITYDAASPDRKSDIAYRKSHITVSSLSPSITTETPTLSSLGG